MNITKGLLLAALALFIAPSVRAQTATMVLCGDAQCQSHSTAVHIGNGQVLTARHAVPRALPLDRPPVWTARLSTGAQVTLIVIEYFDHDLALLQMLTRLPEEMEAFAIDCRPPSVGENVVIVGHPETMRYVTVRGYVAADLVTPAPRLIDVALVIAPILSGFSGSGVIAEDGRLIGIVTAMAANSNYGFVQPITKICDQLVARR